MAKHDKPRELEDLIDNKRPCLAVCVGKKCAKAGTKKVLAAAQEALSAAGLDDQFPICLTKCQDYCDDGPAVTVLPGKLAYVELTAGGMRQIVASHLAGGEPVRELLTKRSRKRLEKQERRSN